MKTVLWCLLIVNSLVAEAREVVWSKGSCVLHDNTVVTGEISVDQRHDVVLTRSSGKKVDVYPAARVRQIFLHDEVADMNRRFVSIRAVSSYGQWSLYEVVTSGAISVYRKQRPFASGPRLCDRDDFSYFVSTKDGLVSLNEFQGRFLTRLKKAEMVANFIRDRRLDIFNDGHTVEIIRYYNSLPDSNHQVLSRG